MSDDQLKVEVDWCLARLEEKLAALDPYSKPAQEAAKVHRILKSSKAPVIKKRQAMRNMFGDYREKMRAMEKKNLAAMKKAKLVPVKEPPKESKFLRLGTKASQAHNTSNNAVSSTADDLNHLTMEGKEGASPGSASTERLAPGSAEGRSGKPASSLAGSLFGREPDADFKFNFDGSESAAHDGGASTSSVEASASGNVRLKDYFRGDPSGTDFRFNFTGDEPPAHS